MPIVLVESTILKPRQAPRPPKPQPRAAGLGMLPVGDENPFFGRHGILRPTMFDTPAQDEALVRPTLFPVISPPPIALPSLFPPAAPGNTGPLPPFRFPFFPRWPRGPYAPNGQPNWNTGIVPPDRGNPPAAVSTMTPPIPLPMPVPVPAPFPAPGNIGPLPPAPIFVSEDSNPGAPGGSSVGATVPPPVSATTASMYAQPTASSMFAVPGSPTNNSMFATVQGSGSQNARISGENALSGVPETPGSGKTIALVLLSGVAMLLIWGHHLNKAEAKGRRAAR